MLIINASQFSSMKNCNSAIFPFINGVFFPSRANQNSKVKFIYELIVNPSEKPFTFKTYFSRYVDFYLWAIQPCITAQLFKKKEGSPSLCSYIYTDVIHIWNLMISNELFSCFQKNYGLSGSILSDI